MSLTQKSNEFNTEVECCRCLHQEVGICLGAGEPWMLERLWKCPSEASYSRRMPGKNTKSILDLFQRERERNVLFNDALNTFYLRLYGVRHMVKDHSDSEKGNRCRIIGYSFRLTARVLLYAPSHRQDNTYHGLCYTSRGALAGTRNSSMGPPHEGSIRLPIALWANALPLSYVPLQICSNTDHVRNHNLHFMFCMFATILNIG